MKLSTLLASLVFCAAAPHAMADYVIETRQEGLISTGMTQQQVLERLGKPAANRRFPTGTVTWTYELRALSEPNVFFDVDFDAADHVKAFGRRYEGSY